MTEDMIERYNKQWTMQYEKLVEFKRENGHCLMPKRYGQDKSLGQWVSTQRKYHNKNKLRIDRKIILDEIGFAWKGEGAHNYKPDDMLWHQQHEKLVAFKRTNGHCMVPHEYEQDKSLGQWVHTQRKYHKNDIIRPDRKELLDEIGFAWKGDVACYSFKPDDKLWQKQYEQLVEFKRTNGHCMVPSKYEQDMSLGQWVSTQRKNHVNVKLRLDRKIILDEIGFAWKADTLAARAPTTHNSESEALTRSVLYLPSEAQEEPEQAQGHVKNRFECPSPNKKRPSCRLAERRQVAARANQRGSKASGSCNSVEDDGGGRNEDEEDSKSALLTSSALTGSELGQEVVQEEASPGSSVEEDNRGGLVEEDSNPTLVTSCATIGSDPDQEVLQEEATTLGKNLLGWTAKFEPDC